MKSKILTSLCSLQTFQTKNFCFVRDINVFFLSVYHLKYPKNWLHPKKLKFYRSDRIRNFKLKRKLPWNTKSSRIFSRLGQSRAKSSSSDLGLNSQKFLIAKMVDSLHTQPRVTLQFIKESTNNAKSWKLY